MNKAKKIMTVVLEVVFLLMILALINTLIGGCTLSSPKITTDTDGTLSNTKIIAQTIHKTSWINSFLLLGFVGGLIASLGLGFKRLGLVISAACVAGLFLSSAMANVWFYVGAGLVTFASILLVIAGLFWKHKAIVELVTGFDHVLNMDSDPVAVKEEMKSKQSKPTQQLVQEIKGKLKVKGNEDVD